MHTKFLDARAALPCAAGSRMAVRFGVVGRRAGALSAALGLLLPQALWAESGLRAAAVLPDLPAPAAFAALGFILQLAAVCAGAVAAVLLGLRSAQPQPGSSALAAAVAASSVCGLLVAAAGAGIAGVGGGSEQQVFWIFARLAES